MVQGLLQKNHIKCGHETFPEFALQNIVKSHEVSRLYEKLQKLCLKK